MPVGALLLLYTDGLIERRGEALDLGLDRLLSAVMVEDPEATFRRVTNALIGERSPQNDVAILAIQRLLENSAPDT
jgi:phosphoserine phosphatase RsbU/P